MSKAGCRPIIRPPGTFKIGTNGVGVIEAVGRDVWHHTHGQRAVLSSHVVTAENVDDPAQILIGPTAGPDAAPMLAESRMRCDAALAAVWGVGASGKSRLEHG